MIDDRIFWCNICHASVRKTEQNTCPNCHNPRGSERCSCGAIVDEHDNFCSHCGKDRRWVTFVCRECEETIVALRWPRPKDNDYYQITCPKCGHRFFRPGKDPGILY